MDTPQTVRLTDPTEPPVIWTSKGNLPVAALRYETAWEDTPTYTKFVERHYLGTEIVRESAHVYSKVSIQELMTSQGKIG